MTSKELEELIAELTRCEIAFNESDPDQLYIEYNSCSGMDEFRSNFNRHFVKAYNNLEILAKNESFYMGLKKFLELKDQITSDDGFVLSFSHKYLEYFNLIEQKPFPPHQELQLNKLAEPFIKYQWQEVQRLFELLSQFKNTINTPQSNDIALTLQKQDGEIQFKLKDDTSVSEFMTALAFVINEYTVLEFRKKDCAQAISNHFIKSNGEKISSNTLYSFIRFNEKSIKDKDLTEIEDCLRDAKGSLELLHSRVKGMIDERSK